MQLIRKLYTEIKTISRVSVYGPEPKDRVGILSFNIEGISPHDVALTLDVMAKIMVRSGAHCTLPLMKDVICQPGGTVRVSTYIYNSSEEIDRFLEIISRLSSSLS